MADKNFKILIEYDGSPFYGWQRQKNHISVQGEIEKALSRILNQKISISGSGRTDAGVHALGQVSSFNATTNLEVENIKRGVNSLIKHPIVIRECEQVNPSFHARYSAVSKEYHYHILNREDPCAVFRQYNWHIRKPLDVALMNSCCDFLIGEMDFKSFESTGSPKQSTIRNVINAKILSRKNDKLILKIRATGFLKYMVRNIMGTLVQVGLHKTSLDEFKKILKKCDRTSAGPTAPAQGLFLYKVFYS